MRYTAGGAIQRDDDALSSARYSMQQIKTTDFSLAVLRELSLETGEPPPLPSIGPPAWIIARRPATHRTSLNYLAARSDRTRRGAAVAAE